MQLLQELICPPTSLDGKRLRAFETMRFVGSDEGDNLFLSEDNYGFGDNYILFADFGHSLLLRIGNLFIYNYGLFGLCLYNGTQYQYWILTIDEAIEAAQDFCLLNLKILEDILATNNSGDSTSYRKKDFVLP